MTDFCSESSRSLAYQDFPGQGPVRLGLTFSIVSSAWLFFFQLSVHAVPCQPSNSSPATRDGSLRRVQVGKRRIPVRADAPNISPSWLGGGGGGEKAGVRRRFARTRVPRDRRDAKRRDGARSCPIAGNPLGGGGQSGVRPRAKVPRAARPHWSRVHGPGPHRPSSISTHVRSRSLASCISSQRHSANWPARNVSRPTQPLRSRTRSRSSGRATPPTRRM